MSRASKQHQFQRLRIPGMLALRAFLGGAFLLAGILKAADPAAFVSDLWSFELFPEPLLAPLALSVPVLEILLGFCVLTGVFLRQASFSLCLLCAGFVLVLTQALVRGLAVSCGCFGVDDPGAGSITLAFLRAGLFLATSLLLYRLAQSPSSPRKKRTKR